MSNVDQLLNVGSTCNKVPFIFFSQKNNCFICIIRNAMFYISGYSCLVGAVSCGELVQLLDLVLYR